MTPRYLSFVETGRSRPGRDVVERLAGALDVPLRDRNRLLVAAGIAAAYPEGSLDDEALRPFRVVIDSLLDKHEPYPAFAFDRAYRMLAANRAARRLLPGLATSDWLDATFAPGSALRAATENFAEIAWATVDLLRSDADHSAGSVADTLIRLEAHLAGVPRPAPRAHFDERVLYPRFRFGERVVRTFTAIARFGSPQDVLLEELRVELLFPADEDSARFFAEMAAG